MPLAPKDVVRAWVDAFNAADVDALAALYHEDAVNHQIAYGPLKGRAAIRELFALEFARANMVCVIENLLEDGDWAVMEWSDPAGLRGCGFFEVRDGRIAMQRGYFDKLSFYKAQGMSAAEALAEEARLQTTA